MPRIIVLAMGVVCVVAGANAQISQMVDTDRFSRSHPGFTWFSFLKSNVQVDGTSPVPQSGQVPSTGGPLQNYPNTEAIHPQRDAISPFGASFVLPVAHGRAELFGSMGGVYVPFRWEYAMPNAWLTQTSFGARVALDQGRHVWVGGTARHLTDFADKNRQWGSWSADLTFQSGR